MSDNNNKENIDLDSILSEINSTINKEVSKTTTSTTKDAPKTAKKTPPKPKKPKATPKVSTKVVIKTVPKVEDELKKKLDTAFAKSAKIIEHAVEDDEDELLSHHAVRFIAVTASEVVDDPTPASYSHPQKHVDSYRAAETSKIQGDGSNVSVVAESDVSSPISLDAANPAPKAAPSPDVARDNNPHIKKIRKKHGRRVITKRQRFIAIIGFVMTVLVIIGGIAVVFSTSKFAFDTFDKTSAKREIAENIFPFVIIDIPEFDDIKKLDNSAIISSAIWAFIIDGPDRSKYVLDDLGSIFVPEVDIELYVRKLFGNDVTIKHQTVDNTSVMMFYDEPSKMYTIESTPKILPYRPRVDKISEKDDVYTTTVSYLLPDAMWNFETSAKNEQVGKTMEYVLKKNKNGYQVLSVKLISVAGVASSEPNMMAPQIVDDEMISSEAVINAEPIVPVSSETTDSENDGDSSNSGSSSGTASDSDDSSDSSGGSSGSSSASSTIASSRSGR